MARQKRDGGPNKSQAIRDLYTANPKLKVKEVVVMLGEQGIKVAPNLVYLVKGKMKGERGHRNKVRARATNVATAAGNLDAVKTIIKVKALAVEVGGYDALKELVEALSS
jgi:hypothetical protein